MAVKVFLPTRVCKRCKGRCCKTMGCHYSPSDFKDLSFEGLKAEIEKGRIAIDWWEASKREYYLRARHIGEPVVHGAWGGVCVNLTAEGCSLSWDERPLGGKALKPHGIIGKECVTSYSKEDCKNEWKQYEDVLVRLVGHFRLSDKYNQERGVLDFLEHMLRLCQK